MANESTARQRIANEAIKGALIGMTIGSVAGAMVYVSLVGFYHLIELLSFAIAYGGLVLGALVGGIGQAGREFRSRS